MKMRDSWVKIAKFVSVTGLVCGLLVAAAHRNTGGHAQKTDAGPSQVAANQESKISTTKNDAKWREAYGKLPLSFEENQGQTAREVRYVSHGSGYELFLTPQEAVLAMRSKTPHDLSPLHRTATLRALRKALRANSGQLTAVRLRLEGANANAKIEGMDQLPGKSNYFIGNDPKKWHTDVPSYARVKYSGIYPGVDLVFYGNQRRLEYDFVVAPGADPKSIALKVDGARKMRINSHGDLVLRVPDGEVALQKPVVYQNVNGRKHKISTEYVIGGDHRVTFAVAKYERSEPLVVDPVLNYSTYLGGSADDVGVAIAVDGAGNALIAGQTLSLDFPAGTKGTGDTAPVGNLGASFVAELDPTGTKLLYSGYLAGTNSSINELAYGVAVDSTGKVYVTGQTYSTDFPTASTIAGFKPSPNPSNVNGTSYLVKLDPTVNGGGSLIYSTYIGGTNGTATDGVGDIGQAIAVDNSGIAYVAGYTDSTASTTVTSLTNFPIVNGFQTALNSTEGNAFLVKIDTTKSATNSLLYSTFVGGSTANSAVFLGFGDVAYGVAIDAASGNAYLAGVTPSTDFPTNGAVAALQPNTPAGNTQGTAFVTQIDTTKNGAASLIYSTYLGGAVFDEARAIALGPNKVAYVTGTTNSNDFPTTVGAFDTTGASFGKAFVTLIDTAAPGGGAATKKYSTFLGGTGGNTGFGIQADAAGNAYVGGSTSSTDFPFPLKSSLVGGFEPTFPAGAPNVGFIAKLNPTNGAANPLLYSTFFGGAGNGTFGDQIFAIAIDTSNPPVAYVTGQTYSTSATFPVFPTTTAFQTALNPPSDAFVAKLSLIPTVTVTPSPFDFGTQSVGITSAPQTFTLTNNNNKAVTFTSIATVGVSPAANTDFAAASDTCSPSVAAGAQCTVTVTFTPAAAGARTGTLVFTDNDVNSPQNVSLSGTGSVTAPGVGLAPTSLAFGNQVLNTTSAAKTVTLTNTGTAALTINSIAASGDFAETSTGATACPISPTTLAAGANCTISVTFTPTALGARAGTLTITDNAGGSPHTVPLTGSGVNAADFTVTASAAVPATVKAGSPAVITVTVTPIGGFSSPVALTCTEPAAMTLSTCTASPASVTPSGAAVTSQVTVTTTAPSLMVPPPSMPNRPLPIRQIVPLFLALILLFLLPTAKRLRLRLAMATAMLAFLVLAGCSGPKPPVKPGTPPGTYSLTITGTAGATVHTTAAVSLTVN